MSTNDEVRDELPNTTEDAPAVQSSIGQSSTGNSDDDDFVDPTPPAPRQVQRTSKGGDNGKQDVKTTKRKAATVAAKKICQSSKNVPRARCVLSATYVQPLDFFISAIPFSHLLVSAYMFSHVTCVFLLLLI